MSTNYSNHRWNYLGVIELTQLVHIYEEMYQVEFILGYSLYFVHSNFTDDLFTVEYSWYEYR